MPTVPIAFCSNDPCDYTCTVSYGTGHNTTPSQIKKAGMTCRCGSTHWKPPQPILVSWFDPTDISHLTLHARSKRSTTFWPHVARSPVETITFSHISLWHASQYATAIATGTSKESYCAQRYENGLWQLQKGFCSRSSWIIVHFKRLGSRVSHDSFNQYVFFFSKQCTYCKTNAIYTWGNFIRFLERRFLNLFHEYRNVNGTL